MPTELSDLTFSRFTKKRGGKKEFKKYVYYLFPLIPSLRTVARPSVTKDSAMFSPVVSKIRGERERIKH